MAQIGILALALLGALTLVGLPLVAQGAAYPLCPNSGKPPQPTKVPHSRCLSANEFSCCQACQDLSMSLKGISSRTSEIMCSLMPDACNMLKGTKSDVQLCSVFVGHAACQDIMEDLLCAVTCNPDGGNYVKANGTGNQDFFVCSAIAQKAYSACKDLPLPGFAGTVSSILPDAETFLSSIFSSLATIQSLESKGFNTKVVKGTTGCYNGAPELPAVALCCDPLTVPSACPANIVNFTANPKWKQFSGRAIDKRSCPSAAGPSNITVKTTLPPPAGKAAFASSRIGTWLPALLLGVAALLALRA